MSWAHDSLKMASNAMLRHEADPLFSAQRYNLHIQPPPLPRLNLVVELPHGTGHAVSGVFSRSSENVTPL